MGKRITSLQEITTVTDNDFIPVDNQATGVRKLSAGFLNDIEDALDGKQDALTAGANIEIAQDGTISATDTTYTAGTNVDITNGVISATDTTYTAGTNITITNGEISATDTDTLSELTDTTISSPSDGDALVYDSTSGKWVNGGVASDIGDLNDVDITTPTDGQVLSYDATNQEWVNADAGSDVSVTQIQSSGTKIATVTVDDVDTDLYAPTSREQVSSGQTVPSDSTGLNNDIYMKFNRASWESDYELISSGHSIDPQRRWTVPDFDTSEYYRVKILGADEQEATKLISEIDNWYPFPETSTMYLQVTADNELVVRTGSHSETVYGVYATKYYENEIAGIDTAYGNLGGSWYEFPKGTEVIANPSGTGSTDLTKIDVGGTIYNIPTGGSGSSTLAGLTDVDLDTPTDGQGLVYDATNQKWVNGNVGGGGGTHTENKTLTFLNTTTPFSVGDNFISAVGVFTHDSSYSLQIAVNGAQGVASRLHNGVVDGTSSSCTYINGVFTFDSIFVANYCGTSSVDFECLYSGGGSSGGNLYGTTDPTSGLGNNGDIYIQYTPEGAPIIDEDYTTGVWSGRIQMGSAMETTVTGFDLSDCYYLQIYFSDISERTDTDIPVNEIGVQGEGNQYYLENAYNGAYLEKSLDGKTLYVGQTGSGVTVILRIDARKFTQARTAITGVYGKVEDKWVGFPEEGYEETTLWEGSQSITQYSVPFTIPDIGMAELNKYDAFAFEFYNSYSISRFGIMLTSFIKNHKDTDVTLAPDPTDAANPLLIHYDSTNDVLKAYGTTNHGYTLTKVTGIKYGNGGGSGSSSLNYSTDEQVVGTWIDGKPVYELTFPLAIRCNIPAEQTYDINDYITDGDFLIDYKLYYVNSPNVHDMTGTIPRMQFWKNNNIQYIAYNGLGISAIDFTSTYATFRYTKTTD